jgi:hypothetical protein
MPSTGAGAVARETLHAINAAVRVIGVIWLLIAVPPPDAPNCHHPRFAGEVSPSEIPDHLFRLSALDRKFDDVF